MEQSINSVEGENLFLSTSGKHKAFNIAVLKGDGIGPEVTTQSIKVLEAIGEQFDKEFVHVG